jgi:addiction module RelE/StbE family toxin
MNELLFTEQALLDIRKLQKFTKNQIKKALGKIANDPKSEGFELYRDLKGLWSWHVGDYRIVYEIRDKIIIDAVGHRKDIYLSNYLQDMAREARTR